jgi:hypothetical protein
MFIEIPLAPIYFLCLFETATAAQKGEESGNTFI